MRAQTASTTGFSSVVEQVNSFTLARLPAEASRELPSRGQVAVRGTLNGHEFRTVLEPDGRRGHWLRIDGELQRGAGVDAGDRIDVTVEVVHDWPEPEVPADLAAALDAAPAGIQDIWADITPMARWEWVRWVNATANPATRQRRVEVTISKMVHGKRRPCCFDRCACTDPSVSRSGTLLGSS